jgi:hypothetical protein
MEIAREPLRRVAGLIAAGLTPTAGSSWAGIPEPDAIYYGSLRIDVQLQTTSRPAQIELRRGTQLLSATTQLVPGSPEGLYVARLPEAGLDPLTRSIVD